MSAPSRAVPFYCPYCADEDLRPFDPTDGSAGHGQWRCQSCQRAFAVKYLGLTGGWSSPDAEPEQPKQRANEDGAPPDQQWATSKGGTA